MEELKCRIRAVGDVVHALDFQGEIDVYNSDTVKEALRRQIAQGHLHVIINLEQVRYIDSTGLGALLEGYEGLKSRGGTMVIICTHPRLLRIFKITGLQNMMRVLQNEAEAVTALAPAVTVRASTPL